jgi:hypothetical protein
MIIIRDDGHRPLTAAQQFHLLRNSQLVSGAGVLLPGELRWSYEARPTSFSRSYELELRYRQGGRPRTFVRNPDLTALAQGQRLPHVYSEDPVELCLYLPRAREWAPWMPLDSSVVPWSALWLYYFEDWLATGDWQGGGMHPGDFSRRALAREGFVSEAVQDA